MQHWPMGMLLRRYDGSWCALELSHSSSFKLSRGNWQHGIGARGTPPALVSNAIAPWCLQPCFPLTTRIVLALLEQIRQLCRSRVAAGDRSAVVLPPTVCVASGHHPLQPQPSIYGARSALFPLLALTRLMLPHALLTLHVSLSSLTGTAGDGARVTGALYGIWAAISARIGTGSVPHGPIGTDILFLTMVRSPLHSLHVHAHSAHEMPPSHALPRPNHAPTLY
jgi:hypothetical protein